jgi:hypothetical protein
MLWSYISLFLGITLLFFIIKTGKYLDRLKRTLPVSPGVWQGGPPDEDSEAAAARLKTSNIVLDKFILMCLESLLIGFWGINVLDIDGSRVIAYLLMGIAFIAFIYIGLGYRSRWEAMYLE